MSSYSFVSHYCHSSSSHHNQPSWLELGYRGFVIRGLVSNRGGLAKFICLFYRKSKIIELVLVVIKCVMFILHVA